MNKLCYESVKEGTCSRKKCTYSHLQGTVKIGTNVPQREGQRSVKNRTEEDDGTNKANNQTHIFLEDTQQQIHTLQTQIGQILQMMQNLNKATLQQPVMVAQPQVQQGGNPVPQQVQWHTQWQHPQQQWPAGVPPIQC